MLSFSLSLSCRRRGDVYFDRPLHVFLNSNCSLSLSLSYSHIHTHTHTHTHSLTLFLYTNISDFSLSKSLLPQCTQRGATSSSLRRQREKIYVPSPPGSEREEHVQLLMKKHIANTRKVQKYTDTTHKYP